MAAALGQVRETPSVCRRKERGGHARDRKRAAGRSGEQARELLGRLPFCADPGHTQSIASVTTSAAVPPVGPRPWLVRDERPVASLSWVSGPFPEPRASAETFAPLDKCSLSHEGVIGVPVAIGVEEVECGLLNQSVRTRIDSQITALLYEKLALQWDWGGGQGSPSSSRGHPSDVTRADAAWLRVAGPVVTWTPPHRPAPPIKADDVQGGLALRGRTSGVTRPCSAAFGTLHDLSEPLPLH